MSQNGTNRSQSVRTTRRSGNVEFLSIDLYAKKSVNAVTVFKAGENHNGVKVDPTLARPVAAATVPSTAKKTSRSKSAPKESKTSNSRKRAASFAPSEASDASATTTTPKRRGTSRATTLRPVKQEIPHEMSPEPVERKPRVTTSKQQSSRRQIKQEIPTDTSPAPTGRKSRATSKQQFSLRNVKQEIPSETSPAPSQRKSRATSKQKLSLRNVKQEIPSEDDADMNPTVRFPRTSTASRAKRLVRPSAVPEESGEEANGENVRDQDGELGPYLPPPSDVMEKLGIVLKDAVEIKCDTLSDARKRALPGKLERHVNTLLTAATKKYKNVEKALILMNDPEKFDKWNNEVDSLNEKLKAETEKRNKMEKKAKQELEEKDEELYMVNELLKEESGLLKKMKKDHKAVEREKAELLKTNKELQKKVDAAEKHIVKLVQQQRSQTNALASTSAASSSRTNQVVSGLPKLLTAPAPLNLLTQSLPKGSTVGQKRVLGDTSTLIRGLDGIAGVENSTAAVDEMAATINEVDKDGNNIKRFLSKRVERIAVTEGMDVGALRDEGFEIINEEVVVDNDSNDEPARIEEVEDEDDDAQEVVDEEEEEEEEEEEDDDVQFVGQRRGVVELSSDEEVEAGNGRDESDSTSDSDDE